jgi:hypothetical protein
MSIMNLPAGLLAQFGLPQPVRPGQAPPITPGALPLAGRRPMALPQSQPVGPLPTARDTSAELVTHPNLARGFAATLAKGGATGAIIGATREAKENEHPARQGSDGKPPRWELRGGQR